jgi:hypothetical protein
LASLGNAVIGTGGDQQAYDADEEPRANPIGVARISREFVEPFAEHPAKPESEQNLSPEDQYSGFVERDLYLFRQFHAPGFTGRRTAPRRAARGCCHAIFAMTYLVAAVGRLPGFRLDRAGAAPVGASLMVAAAAQPVGGVIRPALDKPPRRSRVSCFPCFIWSRSGIGNSFDRDLAPADGVPCRGRV